MEPDSQKLTLSGRQLKSGNITSSAKETHLLGNESKVKPQIQSQKTPQFKCNTVGNLEAGTGKHRINKLEDNSKLPKSGQY